MQHEEGLAAMHSWNQPAAPGLSLAEFKAGDHVRHAAFGDGVVVSYQPVKDDAEVVVVLEGVGIKKLLLSFAKLEKIE